MGKASKFLAGMIFGAALTGAAVVTAKTAKEIKNDTTEMLFTSEDGKNTVKVECGSSSFARGLTMFKVKARRANSEDDCKIVFFAGSKEICGEWKDNEHFELSSDGKKLKQLCTADFSGKETRLDYLRGRADGDDEDDDDDDYDDYE